MSQKTRSTLSIDAVAQAAAAGVASALNPLNKPRTIAALAGLVLRLFRSKEQSPSASRRPARILQGSSKAAGREDEVKKGGLNHG
jgi:hypothetical protein